MLHHGPLPPPPPPPPPADRPSTTGHPLGSVAAAVGVAAAVVGFIVPAIVFALPGALGAIAVIVAFAAQQHEGRTSALGVFGGLVGIITAFVAHGQYSEAMATFDGILGGP